MDYEVEINGLPDSEPTEPVETPSEEAPQEPQEPQAPQEEPNLYELPDGRKVPPEAIVEEYKKLQSDYTRKSQELATYKNKPAEEPKPKVYEDPDWTPQTYAELIQVAKEEAKAELLREQQEKSMEEQALNELIETQLSEVKQINPNVDENKLFEHAAKFNIPNLVFAYKNMEEMNKAIEAAKQETLKSVEKRDKAPVATKPNQGVSFDEDDVYEGGYSNKSLIETLRQIKK